MGALRFDVGDRVAWTLDHEVRGTVTRAHPDWHDCQYEVEWDGNPSWPPSIMSEAELISPIEGDGPRRNIPKTKKML